MDTTSLSFAGAGGETLGRRGHSKDHRPDLMQMILGVVVDAEGTPVCSEMWPGNTADVRVLVPVSTACAAASPSAGSASSPTAACSRPPPSPPSRSAGWSMSSARASAPMPWSGRWCSPTSRPFTPLCIPRAGGEETQLWVKEVSAEGRRYVVCRNEAEAEKDARRPARHRRRPRAATGRGDKALIGNSAYRRYLRRTATGQAFEIDPGKLADEARYDGIFVLRTNARITPLQAVLRYRDLLQVEDLFRTAKALMRTRPIYHSSDAAIRGHVFCSFLPWCCARSWTSAAAAAVRRPVFDIESLTSSYGARPPMPAASAHRACRAGAICPPPPVWFMEFPV